MTWDELNGSPDKLAAEPMPRGTYPPGSTYKPFAVLAALTAGKRTAAWGMHDPGFFTLGNHTFRDDKPGRSRLGGHAAPRSSSPATPLPRWRATWRVNGIHDFTGSRSASARSRASTSRAKAAASCRPPSGSASAYRKLEQQKW